MIYVKTDLMYNTRKDLSISDEDKEILTMILSVKKA